MLVNHRHKFLFVHIPKTAGGAIRTFNRQRLVRWYGKGWEEVGAAHAPLTREIAARYAGYFKFAVLRNPWKLVASGYRFATQGISRNKKTGQLRQRNITMLEWLKELVPGHGSDPFPWPFPCQVDYVSDANGMLVDQICRHEQLAADIRRILERLDLPAHAEDWEQPTRHFYGEYDWTEHFADPEVRAMVWKLCRKDFAYNPEWERLDPVTSAAPRIKSAPQRAAKSQVPAPVPEESDGENFCAAGG